MTKSLSEASHGEFGPVGASRNIGQPLPRGGAAEELGEDEVIYRNENCG